MLLSSMSAEGRRPCLVVEGSTTREVFEAYIEQIPGKALPPGQVVVTNNLSSHKGSIVVMDLIEKEGCKLL
jgi:hypothetical protein